MNQLLEEKIAAWRHRTIVVLGLGVSNRPLVRLLLENGCRVIGCDRTPREKLDAEVLDLEVKGAELRVGDGYLDNLPADLVFRTPGMHPNTPALTALRQRGAEITSEMEIFFEVCPCTLLAVTGSDGKTTTTTLIGKMLQAAGKTVWLGGNIGTPLLPQVNEMHPEDYAVVELSSFQLMDMRRSPHVAVVTNLAPNHLDIHKDMEEYVEAKKNIFRFQKAGDVLFTLSRLDFEAVSALCAQPDYKNRVQFVATAKEPTLRLKLSSGVDSLRQSKVFLEHFRNCCQM